MTYRSVILTVTLAMTAVALTGQTSQTKTKAWSAPRTPDGKPDLQGVWTNATFTPLDRPASVAGKATLTDAEAAAWEKATTDEVKKYDGKAENPLADRFGSGGTGGYNALFIDWGNELARVDGVKRTSLVIDPPDGKVPPLTPEGARRFGSIMQSYVKFDSVKDRPYSERCLIGFGSTSGPPMLPVLYNNNYQIVQTPTHVMILVEMVHDARIIRINGTHPPSNVKQWLGDSIGHWEDDTLVVDTTNFREMTGMRGSSESLHVVERFKLIAPTTILYRATVDDPKTFTKAWTVELPFSATKGPVYEYACHEGNYSMTDILGGARKAEQEREKK